MEPGTYWILTVIATPGLRYPQAVVLTETTTAVSNALPAGGALGVGLTYTMLSSWGFSKSRSTLSVVVTGIWNNFAKLGHADRGARHPRRAGPARRRAHVRRGWPAWPGWWAPSWCSP